MTPDERRKQHINGRRSASRAAVPLSAEPAVEAVRADAKDVNRSAGWPGCRVVAAAGRAAQQMRNLG
jgi:hypothetical protein